MTKLYYVNETGKNVLFYGLTAVIPSESRFFLPRNADLQLWLDVYGPAKPLFVRNHTPKPWSNGKNEWASGWQGWALPPIVGAGLGLHSKHWRAWPVSDLEVLAGLARDF